MTKLSSRFPGKKALIVEDYFVNQEVTQDILELMGLNVDIAENGLEAIEKYKDNTYDLIFMDVQMPEKDGYETTKEIRKIEKSLNKKTPIIALTANALSGDQEKCLAAGMDEYLTKPLDTTRIEAVLKKYLS
jgi:CheY-like chemotaxis protein